MDPELSGWILELDASGVKEMPERYTPVTDVLVLISRRFRSRSRVIGRDRDGIGYGGAGGIS